MVVSLKFFEDFFLLINDDFLMFCVLVDWCSDIFVCYQNLIGYEEEIEEDLYEDQSLDVEYLLFLVGDVDSVGGLSCQKLMYLLFYFKD